MIHGYGGGDESSIGNASAAVAMANNAIDNARRAAASSRSKRTAVTSPAANATTPNSNIPAEFMMKHESGSTYSAVTNKSRLPGRTNNNNSNNVAQMSSNNMDLKHNDSAFIVLATLLTERLLPKVNSTPGTTHYTLTSEDAAFLQKMLPYSVRKTFVKALRYRLQLLKSGVGSKDSSVGKLSMQCMMLGLDRSSLNVLLELSSSAGVSYPINFKNQGPVATESPKNGDNRLDPYGTTTTTSPQYNATTNYNDAPHMPAETSAESLAKQQILAEIKETKFLMQGSVTPDAAAFWSQHLEELNQRLVALSLEEQLQGGGGEDIYKKTPTKEYEMPTIQQREDYMDSSGRMRNDTAGGYEGGAVGMMENDLEQGHMSPGIREYIQEANVAPPMASMPNNKQRDEQPVCDVVAPSDLPGGYMFEAQLGSRKFLATVPPGGVTKGQRFVSTMRELETIEIPVPLGAWRDGGRECLRDGIFHPLFLNTLFFPCISLGQIMTRTGLDWQGNPANRLVSSISCANMTVLLTFWAAMNASAIFMYRVAWVRGMELGTNYYVPLACFNFFVLVWIILLTKKVRESIRNKYQIPEDHCEGIEDCFCAMFCMPCTICQMGRHTADFDTYRATWCTKTGLPRQVELAPVTFYEDDSYQNMNEGGQII